MITKYKIYFAGEWFNTDTEAIISQALQTGGGPNVSDAYTINGLPGLLYNCSTKGNVKGFSYGQERTEVQGWGGAGLSNLARIPIIYMVSMWHYTSH